MGALPNKLPEDRTVCAFVNLYEGALCVSNGHKLPFFCRRLPWCAMGGYGNLAGWLIPRALHCLVECGVFGWRIRSAGADTPPVFNVFNVRAYRTREAGAPSSRRPSAAEGALPRECCPVQPLKQLTHGSRTPPLRVFWSPSANPSLQTQRSPAIVNYHGRPCLLPSL